MDNKIISDCVVLSNNIDAFIELGRAVLSEDIQQIFFRQINACKKATNAYYLSVLDNATALQVQANALKRKKVDSAIAGGALSGIAGPVAGIYGAIESEKRNQNIDANRDIAAQNVNETNSILLQYESNLCNSYNATMSIINSNTELKNMMEEFRKQKQAQDAEIAVEENKENSKINLTVALTVVIIALSIFMTHSVFLSIIIGLLSSVLLGKIFKLF